MERCDFEDGLCNYKPNTDDDFDWIRITGSQGSQGEGPGTDHTTNTPQGQ